MIGEGTENAEQEFCMLIVCRSPILSYENDRGTGTGKTGQAQGFA